MLRLQPDQVLMELAVDEPDPTIGRVFQYQMPPVSLSGVVGSPTTATEATTHL